MSLYGRVKQLLWIPFGIIKVQLKFFLLLAHIRDLRAFRTGLEESWEQAAEHADLSAAELSKRSLSLQRDVLRLMRAIPLCPDDT